MGGCSGLVKIITTCLRSCSLRNQNCFLGYSRGQSGEREKCPRRRTAKKCCPCSTAQGSWQADQGRSDGARPREIRNRSEILWEVFSDSISIAALHRWILLWAQLARKSLHSVKKYVVSPNSGCWCLNSFSLVFSLKSQTRLWQTDWWFSQLFQIHGYIKQILKFDRTEIDCILQHCKQTIFCCLWFFYPSCLIIII